MDDVFKLRRYRPSVLDKGNMITADVNRELPLFERIVEYAKLDRNNRDGFIEPKKTDYMHIDQYGGKLFLDEYTRFLNEERRILNAMGFKGLVDNMFNADKAKLIRETTPEGFF